MHAAYCFLIENLIIFIHQVISQFVVEHFLLVMKLLMCPLALEKKFCFLPPWISFKSSRRLLSLLHVHESHLLAGLASPGLHFSWWILWNILFYQPVVGINLIIRIIVVVKFVNLFKWHFGFVNDTRMRNWWKLAIGSSMSLRSSNKWLQFF